MPPPLPSPAPASLALGTRLRAPVIPETARVRARAYLLGCGYRELPDGRFARGFGGLTAFSLSPSAWGVEVQVELERDGEGASGRSVFTVAVTGQAPTAWELAFWRHEVLGLQQALELDVDTSSASRRLGWRALGLNLLLAPVLGAVFLGPTAALAWLSDVRGWEGSFFALVAVPTALASFAAAAVLMRAVAGDVGTLPRADAPQRRRLGAGRLVERSDSQARPVDREGPFTHS